MKYLYVKLNENKTFFHYIMEDEPVLIDNNIIIPKLLNYDTSKNYLLIKAPYSWDFILDNSEYSSDIGVLIRRFPNILFDKPYDDIKYRDDILFTEGSIVKGKRYVKYDFFHTFVSSYIDMIIYRLDGIFDMYIVETIGYGDIKRNSLVCYKTLEEAEKTITREYNGYNANDFKEKDIDINNVKTDCILRHSDGEATVSFCSIF